MESTVLIAAKQEYTEQLHDILAENLITVFKDIWNVSRNSNNPLRTFQEKLCDVPYWNNQVLSRHHSVMLEKEGITKEYLEKIIEAVFLSNIKILSVVKLENKKQSIDIKIPDTQNFIHKCIVQLARELYVDPHLIDDRESNLNSKLEIQRNYKRLLKISKEVIDKTIRNMIPMKDILDKYLQAHDDDMDYMYKDEHIEVDEPAPEPPRQPEPVPSQEPTEPVPSQEPTQPEPQVENIFMEQPQTHQEPQVSNINTEQAQPIKVHISETPNTEQNFFSDDD